MKEENGGDKINSFDRLPIFLCKETYNVFFAVRIRQSPKSEFKWLFVIDTTS